LFFKELLNCNFLKNSHLLEREKLTMALYLPKLKYELDALEPFLSQRTMNFHYNKHLQGYINTANTLTKDTEFANKSARNMVLTAIGPIYNNAAQAFNHEFFFNCLCPMKKTTLISANMGNFINETFESFDKFKESFIQSAVSNFGSGWTWLVQNPSTHKLQIINTSNAGNPITDGMQILLCIDVWEHAYYLDYQNARKDYVTAFFDYIDWKFVESNLL
jgi:superoxide dismutase, Fe-Mn family